MKYVRLSQLTRLDIRLLGAFRILSTAEISRRVGYSKTTVSRELRKAGISPLSQSEARGTHSGPNVGRVLTAECRANMRAAKLGTHQSEEHRANRSAAMKLAASRGPAHYLWRGGVTPDSKKQRRTPEYRAWRSAVYLRDNYTCVACGERGGHLQADHIKPWSRFPELRFNVDNGRTLCITCHRHTPTYGINIAHSENVIA